MSRRLTGVDGLRGLACVGVLLVHAWMYTGNRDPGQPALLDDVIGELRLGLTYFFVVSGFLLARPWVRAAAEGREPPRLGRYVRHRAARVLPAYWLGLAGAFAVLAGTGHPRAVDVDALPAFLLFAQNQVEGAAGQLNPPTWSLAVEVGFYAVLPLAGWLILRGRALLACAAFVVVGLGWSWLGAVQDWPETMTTTTLTYLPVFACGIAAATMRHAPRPWLLLAGGWALVIANGWWHSRGGTGVLGHTLRDLPAAVGFATIILAVTARPGRVLDCPPTRWLGTVSYGTYLWHMPVLYFLITRGLLPEAPIGAFAALAGPALVLGAISWYAVERPALEWAAGIGRVAPLRRAFVLLSAGAGAQRSGASRR